MAGDMRVKLFLDLVNRLSPGAKVAAKDLKAIKQAAADIRKERAGDGLAKGLDRSGRAARSAERDLKGVKRAAAELRNERAGDQLAAGLDRASASARRARSEIAGVKRAQEDLARTAAGANLPAPRGGRGRPAGSPAGLDAAAGAAAAGGRGGLMPLVGAYGGYRAASAGVRGTVGTAISREKAMAEVKKKVELPQGQNWDGLEKQISQMAITYGRKFEDIAAIVAEAGASNIDFSALPRFTKLATKAAIGWDMDMREAAQKLFEIKAARGSTIDQLEEIADLVNDQEDNSAAKARDVVEMFQRAGEAGDTAGVDMKASIAFLTALRSGGMQPEVASRMFAAFAGGLRTITSGSEKAQEAIKQLGLDPAAVEKGMQTNSVGTIVDLFQRLEKSGDQAKIALQLFGKEWWDDVLRAKKVLPEFMRLLDRTKDPQTYAGSLDKGLNVELATTSTHLSRLSALASDVGDRLGRWALPAINEGVERVIAGLDAIDKRAEQKKEVESLAQSQAKGEALTPEQREKLAGDHQMALAVKRRSNQISAQSDYEETTARTAQAEPADVLDERRQLLRRQLQRQVDTLESEQKLAPGEFGLGKQKKLQALRNQLAEIPAQAQERRVAAPDPRRPADQAERGQADRGEAEAQRERVRQITSRVQALDDLAATASNPADKQGFKGDADVQRARLSVAARELATLENPAAGDAMAARQAAPNAAAAGAFGFNKLGGAPDSAAPKGPGPGLLSFGLNGAGGDSGAAWASAVKSATDIDLGPAGMTMMERLNAGLKSGAAGAESTAAGVKTGIEAALQGGDLSGAGASLMSTFAAGITAGGAAAVAAAQGVAGQVKAALAAGGGGGSRGLSGSLHDGVD
ncbi:phage tail tape measure protein, TP901 family, core region [Bosea sp. CRIB-10]|uniref:phage tail tape measure protein n=1 Tax=Bosea sp. CRIB-10 TaxID=378404 RepID=UPI0008E32FDB|nr:phage tail tape measure protein [Bosea sp. CRIB-10]SFC22021.1 phage tail tape measure protein, TP901 family, core region [Bosea sp. CRIB-10]